MRGLKVVCMLLTAILIYNVYVDNRGDQQAAQVVQIIDNQLADQKVTAMCMKDGEKLKTGDVCELYFDEDTTIRRLDGSVSSQEDLRVGEIVKLQYASQSLKYRNNKKKYFINRVAFILKADSNHQEGMDANTNAATYTSFEK